MLFALCFTLACLGDVETKSADDRLVIRMSRELFEDLLSDSVDQMIPVETQIESTLISGEARLQGKAGVQLKANEQIAAFYVVVEGSADSSTTSQRGPALVYATANTRFSARTRIDFDGKQFTANETVVEAEADTQIQGFGSTQRGIADRLIRRVAARRAPCESPRIQAIALEQLKGDIADEVDTIVADLLVKLNRTTPFEESVVQIYPQTREWVYRMSTTDQFLQTSAGPEGGTTPKLPEKEGQGLETPIEVWMHESIADKLQPIVAGWDDAHKLLGDVLGADLRGDYDARPSRQQVDGWTVLSIGHDLVDAVRREVEVSNGIERR